MDITSIGTKSTVTDNINRKITLKFFKEKKTSRTYIIGLENFMNDNEIKIFINTTKKKLGTGLYVKEEEKNKNKKEYGFQGDHIDEITKILMDTLKISKDTILR